VGVLNQKWFFTRTVTHKPGSSRKRQSASRAAASFFLGFSGKLSAKSRRKKLYFRASNNPYRAP
jgi:hypothetical protein